MTAPAGLPADLLRAVLAACREHAAAPALTGPDGRTLSYGDLGNRVATVADVLSRHGMGVGDRVLFSVRPSPEGVLLSLGIVAAGASVVFADPGVGEQLFAARMALVAPRWAAAESLLYAVSSPVLRGLARRRGVLLPSYRALPVRHVHTGRWLPGVPRKALSLNRLLAGAQTATGAAATRPRPQAPAQPYPGEVDPAGQEALVVFTSGTTAAPRAVVHTRHSLGAGLGVLAAACRIGPGDIVHTDQFMLGLPALVAGAHWGMPPYGFAPGTDPARYSAGLAGATHTFATPAELAAVLDLVTGGRLRVPETLRHLLVGGAPVLPALLRRAAEVLPEVEILSVYGMTEIVPVAVASAVEKLAHDGPGDLVGRPLPGVAVRVDADGELVVAGPHLCRGYLGEPPLTEHATGDLARLDGQGRIVLLGRKKEMLIRGRTNIYPGLYEPAVARLPGVGAAALLGQPDRYGDERVLLVVAPDTAGSVGVAVAAGATNEPARVLPGHPLAARVRAALPTLIDAAALPDEVVVVSSFPVTGRADKLDRTALLDLVRGAG